VGDFGATLTLFCINFRINVLLRFFSRYFRHLFDRFARHEAQVEPRPLPLEVLVGTLDDSQPTSLES
jgi:hypothetical protein